jgi:AcrR family transcriptional regulator
MSPPAKSASYHHGDLRNSLIEAGVETVSAREEISLRALAKQVGVSPAAVYRHFDNKESLLLAIAEQGFGLLEQAFDEVTQAEPLPRLIALGEAYVRFALAHPGHYRVMFDRQPMAEDPQDPLANTCWSTFRALTDTCAQLSANPDQAKQLAIAAWSLVHGYALLSIMGHVALFPGEPPQVSSLMVELARMASVSK